MALPVTLRRTIRRLLHAPLFTSVAIVTLGLGIGANVAIFSYQGVARLRDGVTLEAANADVARMLPMHIERFPMPEGLTKQMFEETRMAPNVRPLAQDVIGDVGSVLWVLLGTVAIVFLIACANVANLFLVRAEGRQQELAIHAALGASR